jgi:hypothetical protein
MSTMATVAALRTAARRAGLHLVAASVAASILLTGAPASAQEPAVTASYESRWIGGAEAFELRIAAGTDEPDARLAVMIDDTDWSGLFTASGAGLTFRPGIVPLPRGERELVIYAVSSEDGWRELGRVPLRVRTAGGFEKADAQPTLEVNTAGLLADGHHPDAPLGRRGRHQDVTANLGVQTTLSRNGWTSRSQSSFVAVTNEAEALTFGQRGEGAPRFDLSQYLVDFETGRAKLSLGHVTANGGRHLVQGFATRGASAALRLAPALDTSLAIMNGSSIVGFSNFFGLDRAEHRIVTATVGAELAPARPGAARVTTTVLDGSLLPLNGFNQGAVADAEKSRGFSVDVSATDPAQRLRIDAGFSRSRFENPADPLLAQGFAIVPVAQTTRGARYMEGRYALVQNRVLAGTTAANLAVAIRHERIDPLYRSVAAGHVQADLLQHVLEVDGGVGPLLSQFRYARSHDNLGGLASLLTTRTRSAVWMVTAPLGRAASPWTPLLTYTLDRTHQFGDALPVNADFDSDSQVPDQVSLNQSAGVAWQGARWRAGYQHNRSFQDNRQPGRELADLLAFTHAASLGATPAPTVDLNLELAWEGAENRELIQRDLLRRLSLGGVWRPAQRSTLTGTLGATWARDDAGTAENRNTDFQFQFAQALSLRPGHDRPQGHVFVRLSRQTLYTFALLAGSAESRRAWSLHSGLALRIF